MPTLHELEEEAEAGESERTPWIVFANVWVVVTITVLVVAAVSLLAYLLAT
jgi:hypothetical protein